MTEPFFINFHTHYINNSKDVISILNINLGNNEKWSKDIKACSIGIHPWNIDTKNIVQHFFELEDFTKESNVIAVGEVGLDKSIETPLILQTKVLEQQIEIANYYNKPIIIHCVRAYSELIALKKKMKPHVPLIIHGFNKNLNVLDDLLKNDFYISLGAALLQSNSYAATAIKRIPREKLFLETDSKEVLIQGVYLAAVDILDIDLNILKKTLFENLSNIKKW
jgi:TatD DNase family protein